LMLMENPIHRIEERRLEEQARLDNLKTSAERNKWGQFATPPDLAIRIVRHTLNLARREAPLRFLDPAVGTGSFFSALAHVVPPGEIAVATGIELDPLFAETTKNLWAGHGLDVIEGDFTRQSVPKQRFNLILTNPPYVRHHHLSAREKDRLRERLSRSLNLPISGLAGLYCYFLLLAHDWMEEGGLAVWLIPSEFMDVNYGSTLRRYLTERVTLLQIHRFCPNDEQFADALVTSAVVIFRKSLPPLGHAVRFSFAGPIDQPSSEAVVPLDTLSHSRKWTQFPSGRAVNASDEPTLGDIFHIKRGLATGSNSFFILTDERVNEWRIPHAFLKPILPGPRYLTENVVEALPDGTPNVSPRLYLLDCNEPEERIRTEWPRSMSILSEAKPTRLRHHIFLVIARRGIRRKSARPRHFSVHIWGVRGMANSRSVLSGTVHRRLRTTCISCFTRGGSCGKP
jgi:hypothetical protein